MESIVKLTEKAETAKKSINIPKRKYVVKQQPCKRYTREPVYFHLSSLQKNVKNPSFLIHFLNFLLFSIGRTMSFQPKTIHRTRPNSKRKCRKTESYHQRSRQTGIRLQFSRIPRHSHGQIKRNISKFPLFLPYFFNFLYRLLPSI